VKGLTEGVERCLTQQKKPVHVLYAGTGPFATLVLPLLSRYSPAELQLSLLEINPDSFAFVQGVFQQLAAEDYVSHWLHDDATSCRIPAPGEMDILLSETMQMGLKKEQQVPIVWHLLRQLSADVLLIPEAIDLELVIEYSTDDLHLPWEKSYNRLGNIYRLDKSIAEVELAPGQSPADLSFPKKTIHVPAVQPATASALKVLTEIQVLGETRIRLNESGLTIPWIPDDLRAWQGKGLRMETQYQVGDHPGVTIKLTSDLEVTTDS
jgi:hypothetical protein